MKMWCRRKHPQRAYKFWSTGVSWFLIKAVHIKDYSRFTKKFMLMLPYAMPFLLNLPEQTTTTSLSLML
jgi:hypothetical protein